MKFYLAPLEGITTYVYRNAHHKYFQSFDKYFTPFIVPHKNKKFSTREKKELSPDNNRGLYVVPQLLTNDAEDFYKTARDIQDLGYQEINLNLGCPSGTVVSKKKGSGFLACLEELDRFLDTIYRQNDLNISIKTRIGVENPEEFEKILDIYNQYPVYELIIHPRVQKDYYRNVPNLKVFDYAVQNTNFSLCYNGDLFEKSDFEQCLNRFGTIENWMFGRGVIQNPGLVQEIRKNQKTEKSQLLAFHNEIYNQYRMISDGDRNTLFKMKELWTYMKTQFADSDKLMKKIKKSQTCAEYEYYVEKLFYECALR